MTVVSQSQKNQIEGSLAGVPEKIRHLFFVFKGRVLGKKLSLNPMDVSFWNVHDGEKVLEGRAIVAFRIIGRNASFVPEKHVNAAPLDLSLERLVREGFEKLKRRLASGKHARERTLLFFGNLDEKACRRSAEFEYVLINPYGHLSGLSFMEVKRRFAGHTSFPAHFYSSTY